MTLRITARYEFHEGECHYADCRYAVCRYAVCRYAKCRGAFCPSHQPAKCSLNRAANGFESYSIIHFHSF
jgi:hypothetical protein